MIMPLEGLLFEKKGEAVGGATTFKARRFAFTLGAMAEGVHLYS